MKKNKFLYILSLPFLGIYYTFDYFFVILNYEFIGIQYFLKPIMPFFVYVSLGCYYTVYGLFFPLIFLINKMVDAVYDSKNSKKIDLDLVAPYENINMEESNEETNEEEENKKLSFEEYLKKKWSELSFIKNAKLKEEEKIRNLIIEVQRDNNRSETPVVFRYLVKDKAGKKITNYFVAHSKMEVLTYLTNEGYKVLEITTSKMINVLYSPDGMFQTRFSQKDLIFWLTQLSTYLKSGITLTESMRYLSKQMGKSGNNKRLFDSIIYNLTLGESFSNALAKQGNTFPPLLISMIKTAEATGELEKTLDDMANYFTEVKNTKKAMISAMIYPTAIFIFSIVVVTFILLFVVPQFQGIYESAGAELNPLTIFLINASNFLKTNLLKLVFIIFIVILIIVILYQKVKVVRRYMQELFMRFPKFGNIIIYKEMSVFAKTFSSLLKNNVFITDSINLLLDTTNNEIYKEIMISTINNIVKGNKISDAFYNHWAVPDVAYYMIVTGESTGELAEMMQKVAEYYQNEHKSMIDNIKALIEPIMIIFLAVVVGGVVLAVILPMFGLYEQIQ